MSTTYDGVPATMTLGELGKLFNENAKAKGFWRDYCGNRSEISEKLMLVVGELAEAQEELRKGYDVTTVYTGEKGKPEGFGVEIADCLIRILDLCEHLGLDIESLVALKHGYNTTRPFLHGKVF